MMRTLCFTVLLAATLSCAAEPLPLEPATTRIVAQADERDVVNAAAVLRDWLCAAARVDRGFDIVAANAVREGDVIIALGETPWSDASRTAGKADDAFSLLREGRVVTITGQTPAAVRFGVREFLDRYIGVRFYLPTDLFVSLPPTAKLSLPAIDMVSEPFVTSCFFSGIDHDNKTDRAWVDINGAWRRKGGTHQHNMFTIFPPSRFAESHPEIYPIIDGKRYIPKNARVQGWQANFIEPAAVDCAEQSIVDYFTAQPNEAYIAVSINDSRAFSEDDKTRAVIERYRATGVDFPEDRAHSEIYWQFVDALGRRLLKSKPDKQLVALAYGGTRFPPKTKLPDNVVVFTNFHIAEQPRDGFLDQGGLLDQWLAVAGAYANHDWYQGSGYMMPRIYSGYFSTFVKTLASRMDWTYQHVECYPNWGFGGPKLYILTRLFWDPQADPDGLLVQFCDDMFGPAASDMTGYFRTLEALWTQVNITEGPERKLFRWHEQLTFSEAARQTVAEARARIDSAAAHEALTDEQRQRIAFFSDSFALTEKLVDYVAAEEANDETFEALKAYAADLNERHPIAFHHRHLLSKAIDAIHWAKVRRAQAVMHLPRMEAPTIDGSIGDSQWDAAAASDEFVIRESVDDERSTAVRIGSDEQFIYLAVACNRADMSNMVETDDTSWRSDNVEVFFDLNADPSKFERQMWVKSTGLLVDHTGRNDPNPKFRGAVTKRADGWDVEIAIPMDYVDDLPNQGKLLGIQVVRNEFTPIQGVNRETYVAVWSRRLIVR